MHTVTELSNGSNRAKTTVMDTLKSCGIEFVEHIGWKGGRPQKLYKITIPEFIKLQDARKPGIKPKEEKIENYCIDYLLSVKFRR